MSSASSSASVTVTVTAECDDANACADDDDPLFAHAQEAMVVVAAIGIFFAMVAYGVKLGDTVKAGKVLAMWDATSRPIVMQASR